MKNQYPTDRQNPTKKPKFTVHTADNSVEFIHFLLNSQFLQILKCQQNNTK